MLNVPFKPLWFIGGMLAVVFHAAFAFGQGAIEAPSPELSFGTGYAHISLGSHSAIDGEDAWRFESSVSFSPFARLPQLRLGADLGTSLVVDNSNNGSALIISNGSIFFFGTGDIPLWTLEPELRLSFRQTFGRGQPFFIEPGIAGGVAFAWLDLHSWDHNVSFHGYDETFYGRAFLRGGIQVPSGVIGIESSWMQGGRLDFGGNASGDLTEFYIGVYGAFRF
jgi:hypothetical protein